MSQHKPKRHLRVVPNEDVREKSDASPLELLKKTRKEAITALIRGSSDFSRDDFLDKDRRKMYKDAGFTTIPPGCLYLSTAGSNPHLYNDPRVTVVDENIISTDHTKTKHVLRYELGHGNSNRLFLPIDQTELDAFIKEPGDFPAQGIDALLISTGLRESTFSPDRIRVAFFPSIRTIDSIETPSLHAVTRLFLMYTTEPQHKRFEYNHLNPE